MEKSSLRSFMKDATAIALGIFVGVMIAGELKYPILIGGILGMIFGYIFRLVTEPKRLWSALKIAYNTTISWRPKEDWKERLKLAYFDTLSTGGFVSMILGAFFCFVCFMPEVNGKEEIHVYSLLLLYLTCNIFFTIISAIISFPIAYFGYKEKKELEEELEGARDSAYYKYNTVVLHYRCGKYFFICLWWCICKIPKILSLFKMILQFLRKFAVTVHHDSFTTCGIYTLIGAGITLLCFSQTVWMVVIAAIVGGIIGASLRRCVLRILSPKLQIV